MQASRIERDLGDPARLLTELASDGLDISSIVSQPRSTAAAALGNAPESIVIDWDEDVGVLMEEEENNPESIDIMLASEDDAPAEDSIPVEDVSEEENQNKKLKEKHLNADAKNLKKVNNIVDQLAGGATQLKKVNEIKIMNYFFNCAKYPLH